MATATNAGRGFTLIEVLVSVVILVMIVLMMSTLFHQSSLAWDSGARKVEGNIQARCLLALITRELSHAVSDNKVFPHVDTTGGDHITFFTLSDDPKNSTRIAKEVTYTLPKGSTSITRSERRISRYYDGWDFSHSTNDMVVMDNAAAIKFVMGPQSPKGPPPWIRVELAMDREDDVSALGVKSYGPDRKQDLTDAKNKDDIVSW